MRVVKGMTHSRQLSVLVGCLLFYQKLHGRFSSITPISVLQVIFSGERGLAKSHSGPVFPQQINLPLI